MNRVILFVPAILMLLCTPWAYTQQQKGDVELQFVGYYYTTVGTEFSMSSGVLQGKLGYYLSDHLEMGMGPTLSITSTTSQRLVGTSPNYRTETETETTTDFGTTAFMTFSFLAGKATTVPYFGVQYYKSSFKQPISEDRGQIGISAGTKFFFSKKAAFDIGGNYLFDLNEDAQGGILLFVAGISFLL